MKCFILCAGLGTRMGELSKKTPKQMLSISGKPKLAWSIEMLPEEIEEVFLIVGYKKEQLIDYFKDFYGGKKINYLIQEELNGSAGAIKLAEDLIQENERFLVLMGDDLYLKSDLEKMIKVKEKYVLLAYETKEAEKFGLVSVEENNYLNGVLERPHRHKEGLVNTGAYILGREYFKIEMVPISEKEFGLPQTMIKMSKDEKVKIKVFRTKKWFPIGDLESYQKAEKAIKDFLK